MDWRSARLPYRTLYRPYFSTISSNTVYMLLRWRMASSAEMREDSVVKPTGGQLGRGVEPNWGLGWWVEVRGDGKAIHKARAGRALVPHVRLCTADGTWAVL